MSRAAPSKLWRRLFSEPRRPAAVRTSGWAPWLAVGSVCIGAFMGQLDASIVTVALPSIGRDLHAGLGAVEWVVLAYAVVLVGAVAMVGRLADAAGRKLLYTYGFVVFAAASAACAWSASLPVLVGCRVVQGVGAVMLQANSVALIREAAPRGRLGTAIGLQGVAQAVGLAAGPSVGGVLVAAGGWRLIFLINVPVGAVGVLLAWLLLPRSRDRAGSSTIDLLGAALLAGTGACALASLSLAAERGTAGAAVGATAAAAALLGAASVRRQRRHPGSVVDAALTRSTSFVLGCWSALFAYATLFGALLVVPFFLEGGLGLGAREAGFWLTALPVMLGVAAPLGGRLADRLGPTVPTVTGMALAAAGLAVFAAGGAAAVIVLGLALTGAGLGLYTPANNAAVMASAPSRHTGSAAGVLNMTRGLGSAVGVAVAALLYGLISGTGGHGGKGAGAAGAAAGARAAGVVLALSALVSGALASVRTKRRTTGERVPPTTA